MTGLGAVLVFTTVAFAPSARSAPVAPVSPFLLGSAQLSHAKVGFLLWLCIWRNSWALARNGPAPKLGLRGAGASFTELPAF